MEILEDIIEAFPGFLTDEPVNGGDLVEFVGGMIVRYESNRIAVREHICRACKRPELDCSRNPCETVIREREE